MCKIYSIKALTRFTIYLMYPKIALLSYNSLLKFFLIHDSLNV